MTKPNNKQSTLQTLRFYLRHLRKFPHLVIPELLILPLNVAAGNYLAPLVLATVIDRLSKGDYIAGEVWQSFSSEIMLFLAISIVGPLVLWRLFDMFHWRLYGRVTLSIHAEVFDNLLRKGANFHANHFGGSLVSAANKLASSYDRFMDTTLFVLLPLVFSLVFIGFIMLPRAPLYALLLIVSSILYVVISLLVSARVRERAAKASKAETKQTGALADAITNVMAVKSFSALPAETKRFDKARANVYAKILSMMWAFQRQQIYLGGFAGIMSTIALVVAIFSVVVAGADLDTAFLIFSYTGVITSQLFNFSNNGLRALNRSFGDAREMVGILAEEPEVQDPESPEKPRITKGTIAIKSMDFTHADQNKDDSLFTGLNLQIAAGEKVGLVGHSGSGKSTLIRLLMRFNDVDAGEILIDGQNIANITQDDLRRHIAYVPQEPMMFHRTIRENIAYGKPDAAEDEVREAARKAHAAEFIEKLPKGYETIVGERGVKLSGGQRQRIAIARAILKDAPILMLDEATSALDSESEKLIQAALWELMKGRTAIVIAHRLSTIQKMDRIIVLDKGTIIEQGTHTELLHKGGAYAKLWAHQSGGFIEE